jgi:DNA-directed RNA polymerase subunit RPC12/RpoP
MRLIGTAHEEARRVSLGQVCVECGTDFVKAHNTPTACSHCWGKLPLEERKVLNRAIHEEATRQAFRERANKKKAKNQENE